MSAKKKIEILQEFSPIGKYRVRLMGNRDPIEIEKDGNFLEIREYVSSESFEGFTRRGVQIKGIKEVLQLQEILLSISQKCIYQPTLEDLEKVHQRQSQVYASMVSKVSAPKSKEDACTSCGIADDGTDCIIDLGLCQQCTRDGGVKYVFERGAYPNQDVLAEKFFLTPEKAIAHAKMIAADHVYDIPSYRNPNTVYSTRQRCLPIYSPKERKEVRMKSCTLCQREIPALGPESGIGYKEETLCGVCLKAAQRVCPHALRKEDGVTCRDCGARPWSFGRVAKGISLFTLKASAQVAKVFVLYTIQAILGSVVTLGLAYFAAKKMGFLP